MPACWGLASRLGYLKHVIFFPSLFGSEIIATETGIANSAVLRLYWMKLELKMGRNLAWKIQKTNSSESRSSQPRRHSAAHGWPHNEMWARSWAQRFRGHCSAWGSPSPRNISTQCSHTPVIFRCVYIMIKPLHRYSCWGRMRVWDILSGGWCKLYLQKFTPLANHLFSREDLETYATAPSPRVLRADHALSHLNMRASYNEGFMFLHPFGTLSLALSCQHSTQNHIPLHPQQQLTTSCALWPRTTLQHTRCCRYPRAPPPSCTLERSGLG